MTNGRFVPSLESARGLAALTVCLFHASQLPFQGAVVLGKNTAGGVLLNGHGAVILFFVLSGFVLRSSLEKRRTPGTFALAADFLIARFFRLFPVIIASVALFLCVAWVVHGHQPQLGIAIRNALLLDTTVNGAFWTLQVEVFGSIIVLVAFLLERRWGVSPVVAMLVVLLPLSFTGTKSMIGPVWPGYFYTFLLGYLIALVPPLPADRPRLATTLLVLALTAFYAANTLGHVYKQWLLLVTALSSCLIVLVLSSASYRERLQWPPIRLLGTVSYAFYALHPLGLQMDDALRTSLERATWPSWVGVAVMLVVPVMVATVLAIPMYRWIERPSIVLGRWLTARRRHS